MVGVSVRHSLPSSRIVSRFGSIKNGSCSTAIVSARRGEICNGTSVLIDGFIPTLSNVSNNSSAFWASQLLTMKQNSNEQITLSFEVENQTYDCVELAVFNCPQWHMNASRINIYSDTSFRPERQDESFGTSKINYSLSNTSCDYLVKFYVSFMPVNSSYFNIKFPGHSSENHVFVGEISFLSDAHDCEQWPPELIENTTYRKI